MARVGVLALLILLASCGKVAQPRPPFIRIPQPVRDLSASQNGYNVVLSWTNPPHYIDGSAATDVALVIIESDGKDIAWLASAGTGKPQSFLVDSRSWIGMSRAFTIRVETARLIFSGKSNVSRITPVDVPGAVVDLQAVVDQRVLTLTWKPPATAPDLADGYFVSRVDPAEPPALTTELEFKDTSYEPGKVYTYIVTAARRQGDSWIQGSQPKSLNVTAVDVTPPKTPTGLQIVTPDKGAFISWDANDESDLAGYHLFRGDLPIGGDLRTTNSFFDPDYVKGSSYSVSAVDEYGNESPRSAPRRPVESLITYVLHSGEFLK